MSTHPMSHIDVDLCANRSPLVGCGQFTIEKPMDGLNQNPQVTFKPEEDARLPLLEAQIEREWRQHRSAYVGSLTEDGRLKSQVREVALDCVRVLHQYEERGLGADQAREAMQMFINPQFDRS